jgi:hypothetical protein
VLTDDEGRDTALWREADIPLLVARPTFGFLDKIETLLERPFERTLYLDADTYVRRPLGPLFDLLDVADFAAMHDNWRAGPPVPVPESFVEPNGGVLLLGASPAVDGLVRDWGARFRAMLEHHDEVRDQTARHPIYSLPGIARPIVNDQPALRWALWEAATAGRIRYATLPTEANVRIGMPNMLAAGAQPFVVHTHSPSGEAAAHKLEASLYGRVWIPGLAGGMSPRITDTVVLPGTWAPRALRSLAFVERVVRGTARRLHLRG